MDEDYDDTCDSVPKELTENQKAMIKKMYDDWDKDKNGTLSSSELRKLLQYLGANPKQKDIRDIMKKYEVKGRKMTYDEFEKMIVDEIGNLEFDLLEAFSFFDKDKSGSLDRCELKKCLQSLGEKLTDDEIDELFDMLDTNKDGTLSILEVKKMLA